MPMMMQNTPACATRYGTSVTMPSVVGIVSYACEGDDRSAIAHTEVERTMLHIGRHLAPAWQASRDEEIGCQEACQNDEAGDSHSPAKADFTEEAYCEDKLPNGPRIDLALTVESDGEDDSADR